MAFDFPSGVDVVDGFEVINPETGATYRWKDDPGKWILVTPLSSAAGRRPIFAPSEPSEHPDYNAPDSDLQIGDIWYDTSDDLAEHVWDGGKWVAVDQRYVLSKGDVMTGPLLMNDGDELDPQPLVIDDDSSPDQAVHKVYVDSLKAHIYVGEKGPDTDGLPIGTLWYDNDEDDLTLYLWTGSEWTTAAPPVATDGAVTTLQGEVQQALAAANRADNRSASNQSSIIEIARAVGTIQDGLGQVTLNDVAFGRKFKYAYNSTDPRDGDGYCYFGNNYLYLSIADLDALKFEINCDVYSDHDLTGSNQRHAIMVSKQNDEGIWQLIGSGYWPGGTDCRSSYVYIKGVNWTKTGWVKGQEYRIKVSPFW